MNTNNSHLTKEEINSIVTGLQKLTPGFLPLAIFLELARLCVIATVEMAPIFIAENKEIFVLMTKRFDDDPFWPGKYHLPGSVIRPTDEPADSLKDALGRVIKEELAGVEVAEDPVFVKYMFRQVPPRNKEMTLLHYVILKDKISDYEFFNVKELPEPEMVPTHIDLIKEIAEVIKNKI